MVERNKMLTNQTRMMAGEIRAIGSNERAFELSFSSETPVERWFGKEILNHDVESIDLQRLKEVGVCLFSHGNDVYYGKMPIASIDRVWLDKNERRLKAQITFDDDANSDKVFQKVNKGLLKGVSFGYTVSVWEELSPGATSSNGRFTGPAYIGMKWEPFEISIEPTPADPNVGVAREIKIDEVKTENPVDNSWIFKIRKKINLGGNPG